MNETFSILMLQACSFKESGNRLMSSHVDLRQRGFSSRIRSTNAKVKDASGDRWLQLAVPTRSRGGIRDLRRIELIYVSSVPFYLLQAMAQKKGPARSRWKIFRHQWRHSTDRACWRKWTSGTGCTIASWPPTLTNWFQQLYGFKSVDLQCLHLLDASNCNVYNRIFKVNAISNGFSGSSNHL